MKSFISILTTVLAIWLALTSQSYSATLANHGQFLYVQTAKSALLKQAQKSDNTFTLTLKDVQVNMTCFAEHPQRTAGAIDINEFIEMWIHPENPNGDNYKNDAPNAIINGTKLANNELVNLPVTLSDPQYDEKTKSLKYKVKKMDGSDKISAMELHGVTIFIDYCTNCYRR